MEVEIEIEIKESTEIAEIHYWGPSTLPLISSHNSWQLLQELSKPDPPLAAHMQQLKGEGWIGGKCWRSVIFIVFCCLVGMKRGRRHDDGANLLGESGRSRMCSSLPGFELTCQISDRQALLPSKQIGCLFANHFPCGCTSLIALVAERWASVIAHIGRYPPHLVPKFVFSLKMANLRSHQEEKTVLIFLGSV